MIFTGYSPRCEKVKIDKDMKYVYGPVPSRRLNQSLGIDPLPLKTCNWNCVYCQLGRSIPLTDARKDYFPPAEILAEAREAILNHQPGTIDWVTFVGSGETLLCASLGWLIDCIKKLTPLPVAVITNGSYLYLPEVRQALLSADAVMPSLDAGTGDIYRKINRPHPQFTFQRLVNGLCEFRQMYPGKFWLEVMLVRDLNDSESSLQDIARIVERIKPDVIHINYPTRPPAEPWVLPPVPERLELARLILGDVAEIIPAPLSVFACSVDDLNASLVNLLSRHPMSQSEVMEIYQRWAPGKADQLLQSLLESGSVQMVDRMGVQYFVSTQTYFPE